MPIEEFYKQLNLFLNKLKMYFYRVTCPIHSGTLQIFVRLRISEMFFDLKIDYFHGNFSRNASFAFVLPEKLLELYIFILKLKKRRYLPNWSEEGFLFLHHVSTASLME